jgi:hypothetical protein
VPFASILVPSNRIFRQVEGKPKAVFEKGERDEEGSKKEAFAARRSVGIHSIKLCR